jgi:hypothetical protein
MIQANRRAAERRSPPQGLSNRIGVSCADEPDRHDLRAGGRYGPAGGANHPGSGELEALRRSDRGDPRPERQRQVCFSVDPSGIRARELGGCSSARNSSEELFRKVSVLFQEDALLDDRTVEANLATAILERADVFEVSESGELADRIDGALRDVGWIRSACGASGPQACPVGCAGGWRWRGRCSGTRVYCSRMSRPRGWIRKRQARFIP